MNGRNRDGRDGPSGRVVVALLLGLVLAVGSCQSSDAAETTLGGSVVDTAETADGAGSAQSHDSSDTAANAGTAGSETGSSQGDGPDDDDPQDGVEPEPADVVLLDEGAEPKSELRLKVPDGATETMVSTQSQKLTQELDGELFQEIQSGVITTFDLRATAVDGGYEIATTVVAAEPGPDVDPALVSQVEQELEAMVGLATTTIIDDRGNIATGDLSGTEGLDPAVAELARSLARLGAPLPAEPVGVGASWEVNQLFEASGLLVEQTTTYTIAGISGSVVELDTTTVQTVDAGSTIRQGGILIDVLSWTSTGQGSIEFDLSSLVATTSGSSSTVQELEPQGAGGTLKQWIEVEVATRAG